jgi:hypothetical protein
MKYYGFKIQLYGLVLELVLEVERMKFVVLFIRKKLNSGLPCCRL